MSVILDKLLQGQSFEWKKLGEVCDLVRGPFGGSLKKEIFVDDGYAVYEQNHAIYGKFEFRYFITEDKFNSLKRFSVKAGDLIMSCSGTMGKLAIIPDDFKNGLINQALLKITPHEILNKYYFKYYFENTVTKVINDNSRGGAIKNVASVSELKKLEIPIPPLNIQAEIVRILDAFTELTAELTAELVARKQQYAYYREKLLTFKEIEVEWTALGDEHFVEIANSGRKPVKSSLRVPGNTPYYGANNIQDYVDGHTHDGEYVLIAEDGSASLERYSIQYTTGRFWANNHVHVVRGKLGLNTRYLYHYLSIVNFIPFLTGGVRAKLTKGSMVEIPIPIPPLAEQQRIVSILDKFDALTTSLTEGLPREIELRQQQYEYYRELLLSFPKAEVAHHD
jgi:type I restriction enzyme S subunit